MTMSPEMPANPEASAQVPKATSTSWDALKGIFASVRDLSIIVAALLFYVGYVYNYNYDDYFGLTIGEFDEPVQFVPIDSLTVLLDDGTLGLLRWLIGFSALAACIWWLDKRYNNSRVSRFLREVPRFIVAALALVAMIFAMARLDDYSNAIARRDAQHDEYRATYWHFTFGADSERVDAIVRAGNARGALRVIHESREVYVAVVTAGPRDKAGDPARGGCVLLIPKRIVTSARIEALDPNDTGTGVQRYFACGGGGEHGHPATKRDARSRK
jgi:hypothetical protein